MVAPTHPAESTPTARVSRTGLSAASTLAAEIFVAFGIVVGFNQLGTQSPVDAILPVAVFSVGIAGILFLLAAALGAATRRDRPRGFLDPPTLDQGFAAFGTALPALAATGWHWGLAATAAVVAARGITLVLEAERAVVLVLRSDPEQPSFARLGLVTVEAVLLLAFAWAALADGGIPPFR